MGQMFCTAVALMLYGEGKPHLGLVKAKISRPRCQADFFALRNVMELEYY